MSESILEKSIKLAAMKRILHMVEFCICSPSLMWRLRSYGIGTAWACCVWSQWGYGREPFSGHGPVQRWGSRIFGRLLDGVKRNKLPEVRDA